MQTEIEQESIMLNPQIQIGIWWERRESGHFHPNLHTNPYEIAKNLKYE